LQTGNCEKLPIFRFQDYRILHKDTIKLGSIDVKYAIQYSMLFLNLHKNRKALNICQKKKFMY
jgi:hypothetical protein